MGLVSWPDIQGELILDKEVLKDSYPGYKRMIKQVDSEATVTRQREKFTSADKLSYTEAYELKDDLTKMASMLKEGISFHQASCSIVESDHARKLLTLHRAQRGHLDSLINHQHTSDCYACHHPLLLCYWWC